MDSGVSVAPGFGNDEGHPDLAHPLVGDTDHGDLRDAVEL